MRLLLYDCVDFWRESMVVALVDMMHKVTTPDVKQSRGERAPATIGTPVCCGVYFTKLNSEIFMEISESMSRIL